MLAIGVYDVSKEFRRHDCRNRWLRRDLMNSMHPKRHEDEWWTVLSGINIEVRAGETLAILGRNGSGKSTLLKLMAGIIPPSTGRIEVTGSVCTLFDVGTGFHEDLTGRENVFVNGTILGLTEKYLQMIMPEIEGFAELEGFMDTPIKYYSSGMRARLGFSVAMSADPDVFLIDEVLAVGDEGFRRKCFTRLDELVSRGATVVMVTHDVVAVQRLCDRGIWLHEGGVYADGPIYEVCREYTAYYDEQVSLRHVVL